MTSNKLISFIKRLYSMQADVENISLPQKNNITKEEAFKISEAAIAKVKRAHILMEENSTIQNNVLGKKTHRSFAGSDNTTFITVTGAQINAFLTELADIDEELLKYNWTSFPKPNVVADLTAITIVRPESLLVFQVKCSIIFSHTTIPEKIAFHLSGKDVVVTAGSSSNFSDKLRISTVEGNFDLCFDDSSYSYGIEISTEIFHSRDEPVLKIEAAGATFTKKFEVDGRFKITHMDFSTAVFIDELLIRRSHFACQMDMLGATFSKNVVFWRCVFENPPDIFNAVFKRQLIFNRSIFTSAKKIFMPDCILEDVDGYKNLRLHFAKNKNSRMEGIFFALEQRGERVLVHQDPVDKIISLFFDILSDYGQSTSRIVVWFIGWNIAFSIFYRIFFLGSLKVKMPFENYPEIFFALQNAFNPLALFSEKSLVSVQTMPCFIFALFQSVGSISIVTLFLLTVRTRFRRSSSSTES